MDFIKWKVVQNLASQHWVNFEMQDNDVNSIDFFL